MAHDRGKAIRSALLTAKSLYSHLPHVVHSGMCRGGSLHDSSIPEGYADGGAVDPGMPEPEKTVKAYKLFRHKDGKLYPLYVNANQEVPLGKWLSAEAGPPGKSEGRVKSKLGDLAYRPGWHSGDMPVATHIGSKSHKGAKAPDTRPPEHVWAEVEHPADVDWQSVAHQRAKIMKSGLPNLGTAHITDQVPHGGHYRYKTNPNMTGNWIISGGMKVNRVLPHEEVQAINQQHGVYDLPRREPQSFDPEGRPGRDAGGQLITPPKPALDLSGYQDAPASKLQDMPWRPLADVHADLGHVSEIPSHVQHFGHFMNRTADKAASSGLTPRDLLKAYAITRASIGRGALGRKTLEANGWEVPEGVNSLRPEGAMGEWLHTKMGQEYLHQAEKGNVHEAAIADAVRKFRPFGKQNDTEGKALAWAAQNLPGMEGHVSKMVAAARHKDANPEMWRQFVKGIPGVNIAKAGFLGSMMGMGNQPTLDARQIILNTGRPTSDAAKPLSRVGGSEQAVDRLAARQRALKLGIPEELEPYYQHLAHHTIWDKAAGEQTTHSDLIHAMEHAARGGKIGDTGAKGVWPASGHELAHAMHAVFGSSGGLGGLWKGASDQNVREQLLNTPDYANPNPELVQKALALAQKTHGVNQTFDSKSGMSYSSFKGGTRPISDVTSTVEPIPGVTPKPVKELDWQDFIRKNKGASLINVGGDRSRLGRLTHINDKALGWPVDLHAGPDYMREPNKGAVWANAQSNATGFANTVKKLGEKGKVFGVYKPMGPQSVDSSRQMSDALMSQIAAQPLDPKVAAELDAELKKGAHEPDAKARAKAVASMESWPGFSNPREARDHLLKLPGTARSLVVKHLDKAGWHAKGVPHVGHTRVALTDPAALTTPGHMLGHRIVELTGGHPQASAFEHNTYPVPTGGKYVGDVPNVLAHYAMPEVQRGFALKHHAAGMTHPLSERAGARSSFIKMMGEQKNVQPINDEMAQGVGHAQEVQSGLKQAGVPGYAEGGVVDQAMALTAPAQPRRALTDSGLYSHAGDAAMALPQAKGSPQQMVASMKGVKPEELAHANPLAKFGDQKSITREQLAGHMRYGLPKIRETRYSDNDIDEDDDGERQGGPKYEEYTVPGGKNYRELLLHLPKSQPLPATPEMQEALSRQNETYWAHGRMYRRDQHDISKMSPEEKAQWEAQKEQLSQEHTAATRHYSALSQEHADRSRARDYKSGHWEEPNVLAHLRMSDRTLPNKETALHLEELQSDWGQDARVHGVRGPEPEPDWQKSLEEMRKRRSDKPIADPAVEAEYQQLRERRGELPFSNGHEETQYQALRRKRLSDPFADPAEEARFQKLHKHEWTVPHGPYIGSTNGWTDLGLKRALVEAARGGHDRLAWSPDAVHDQLYPGRDSSDSHEGGDKGFYDKIVPLRLRDILKKLGHTADYEPVTVTHGHKSNTHTVLHTIKLPKELRDKIKKGLPAFSSGGMTPTSQNDTVRKALRITASRR